MEQTFFSATFKLYSKYSSLQLGWRKGKWKEGSGVKVTWQGAERQQSWQHSKWSPACIHCKIKFPLFSQSQRPWKHLWLSRRPEPASSSSAAQGTTSQPPRSTQPARGTKLKRGMERDDQCLQKKIKLPGSASLSPFILKSHERQEGLHCTWPEIIPCKTFRPPAYPWAAPKMYQQAGEMRWARLPGSRCTGKRGRLGSTIPTQLWVLPAAFTTNWWLSERSVERLFLGAWCYVCRAKSVLLNSFHNKRAPRWFFQL